jgi:hypothetical protein
MMEIVIDIETLPGDLRKREEDMATVAETTTLSCNLTKGAIIEQLGDPQLKYKTLDELKPMWIEANKYKAVEEAYRKRALDGTHGNVCSIALSRADDQSVYSYSMLDAKNEIDLLEWLNFTISEMGSRKDGGLVKPLFIGHNVVFDLKFLYRRFVVNNVKRLVNFPFGGWHNKDYFCTSQAWCGREGRISQDNLCKALGIEGKPGDINGSNVYDHAVKGDWARIEEYNVDDIIKCREVYKRLK